MPVVIAAGLSTPQGMSWGPGDVIFFSQPDGGIMRVSAAGGAPELVIRAGEGEQIYGPQLLPDGDSVLFSATVATGRSRWDQGQVVVHSLRTGRRTVLFQGGSDARYLASGHLVYALDDTLYARAFDLDRLAVSGTPISLVEGVARAYNPANNTAAANFGVSVNGTLVYVEGVLDVLRNVLVWVDRQGREERVAAPVRSYAYPRLSPEGTRVGLSIRDEQDDIWVWDLRLETLTRVTLTPLREQYVAWTPDGRRLLFNRTNEDGNLLLYSQAADGTGEAQLLTPSRNQPMPYSVTPDGKQVLLRIGTRPPYDLGSLMLGGAGPTTSLLAGKFNEVNAEVSPDGRWLAYESDESGRQEVYVRPFPDLESGRWQVSRGGGTRPVWARDGAELFYLVIAGPDTTMMGVRIEQGATWLAGAPMALFTGRFFYNDVPGSTGQGRTFDVSPDGKRFLMIKDAGVAGDEQVQPARFVVVQHFDEELRRLVPVN
jgi:serine/threonine-protein kinase